MTTGESTPESAELSQSRDLVRSAAKWFIAGLGGIGAILVAGSQLSSVGALPADSARFWLALAGVSLGLLAILWAMWRVVDVLTPTQWAFEDLVAVWNATPAQPPPDRWWNRRKRRSVGRFLRDHPLLYGNQESPEKMQQLYEESEPDRQGLDDLVDLMDTLLDKAATVDLQSRFRTLRWQIATGVLIGAAGIILFAWAANPATPDQPPPSFRNADLTDLDFHGASLRNVDLTGADLTGANLLDADLAGAVLEDVTWSNTTCPDGTNSDSRATKDAAGALTGGTCEGHMTPTAD
jgi:hypothetical protein